jgi:hypothetical protein
MPKAQSQPSSSQETAPSTTALVPAQQPTGDSNDFTTKLATVAAVGIGAALIEVEWIPGILLGAAAMLAPNLLPRIGNGIRPLVKGAVRAGYSVAERTKETVAEASEQFQDIVAEVRAEQTPQSQHLPPSASGEASQPA